MDIQKIFDSACKDEPIILDNMSIKDKQVYSKALWKIIRTINRTNVGGRVKKVPYVNKPWYKRVLGKKKS